MKLRWSNKQNVQRRQSSGGLSAKLSAMYNNFPSFFALIYNNDNINNNNNILILNLNLKPGSWTNFSKGQSTKKQNGNPKSEQTVSILLWEMS